MDVTWVLGIALGIAQYFSALSSIGYWAILLLAVIPNTDTAWTPWYQLPADDSGEIGEEMWWSWCPGKLRNSKYNTDISFYNIHGYFNSHSICKLVLYSVYMHVCWKINDMVIHFKNI